MTPVFEFNVGALSWTPSLAALVILAVLLSAVILTISRARRRLAVAPAWRQGAVTLLNLLALLAMAVLLAPPHWSRPAAARVTLLTEGAETTTQADAFVVGPTTDADNHAQRLYTAGQLQLRRPDLDTLQVLGHGLDDAQWTMLPASLAVTWTPPAEPLIGPTGVQWASVLEAGDPLVVTGTLRLADSDHVAEVRLVDPAGFPAATLSVRSGQPFGLSATPRAPGALIYRLEVLRGDDVIAEEPVATWVRESKGARLLVRQSAPSFETRQLANWSADRGNPLVIHTRISQNRDLVQGINLPDDAPLELSPTLLAETDLAVMDGRSWAALSGPERGRMLDAVRAGLGLLLLLDSELAAWLDQPTNATLAGIRLTPERETEPRWLAWRDAEPEQPLPVAPWRIVTTTAQRLNADDQGDVLETWQSVGEGRIAISRLRERHRWATGGDRSVFTRYWAEVLRVVGRESKSTRWLAAPADTRLRPGRRAVLCARGKEANQLRLVPTEAPTPQTTVPLLLVPHASGAPLRCGHIWPADTGWHRLQLFDDKATVLDEIWVRVFPEETWAADRLARRQSATLARTTPNAAAPERTSIVQPISPWWAWGLLLFTAGLLWLERRLFDLA